MKQSDVKLGTMYVVRKRDVPFSLCKVRQYGMLWVKVVAGRDTRRYGNLDILKRYHPDQVVITVEEETEDSSRFRVLVDGEILTMNGRSWRSMVEVEQ
tara:strand:- start:785 stop:1078 length:294 start_codon:yes stop_codon:yes gene_type:complete